MAKYMCAVYVLWCRRANCSLLSHALCVPSLEDVVMQESKLFLVFEYLNMDLKKYLDSFVSGTYMDKNLVKSYCYQVMIHND